MAGIFFSCENDLKEVGKFAKVESGADQTVYNMELVSTDSGKVTTTLKAGIIEDYLEQKLTKFKKGFLIKLFDKQGNVTSTISGINAEIYNHDKKLVARDSVVYSNLEQNQILYTEELYWDQTRKKIFTNKDVRIVEGGNKVLLGEGLVTDENFTTPYIIKPKGEYYLKQKDTTK